MIREFGICIHTVHVEVLYCTVSYCISIYSTQYSVQCTADRIGTVLSGESRLYSTVQCVLQDLAS